MIEFIGNKISFNQKLCQQCGACIAVCKQFAIIKQKDSNTGLLRLEIDHEKCINCKMCHKVCSANKDSRIDNVEEYCKSKRYFLGHNVDEEIRRKASSGGIARSIIVEGLTSGLFDGVYTLKKSTNYPFAEGCFYTQEN